MPRPGTRRSTDPDRLPDVSASVRCRRTARGRPVAVTPVTAVATTGIYCRPDCSARPDPRNVHSYADPAAAEAAGYRACLRCRPYRRAVPVVATGPDLVCRAVHLVVGGALDSGTETDLAARLGVSARHLRRLFVEHVGATPDQVARSRRAHFARRLLDDTDLTVTQIAFASGYGSVRQLNRACTEVFRAPPLALRARRRRDDRLAADGGLPLRLPYEGPLDWDGMLAFLAARAIPGVESVRGGAYRRTVVVGGDPGVVEVSAGPPGELRLVAHLPHWEGLIHVVARVRRIFALDADPSEAVGALGDDPVVGPLFRARPGLRVPGCWDGFETGVRIIAGQQVAVATASRMAGAVAARLGRAVPGLDPLGLGTAFPAAADVVPGSLAGIGLTPARQQAVAHFATAVAGGQVVLDGSTGLERLATSLEALPGIGPWTAQALAMRLGERDAFPEGDLAVRRAVGAGTGRPAGAAAIRRAAAGWSPHRAAATFQLWAGPVRAAAGAVPVGR